MQVCNYTYLDSQGVRCGVIVVRMGIYTDKLPAATVEQLQAERGGKRLTYKQLADMAELKEQTVMRYLTGKRDIPLHELVAMTEALGLSLGELFERATQRIK